jgi:hypothetical protein
MAHDLKKLVGDALIIGLCDESTTDLGEVGVAGIDWLVNENLASTAIK